MFLDEIKGSLHQINQKVRKGIVTIYNQTFLKNIIFALCFTCIEENTFAFQRHARRIIDALCQNHI